jgi:hypothetical protein
MNINWCILSSHDVNSNICIHDYQKKKKEYSHKKLNFTEFINEISFNGRCRMDIGSISFSVMSVMYLESRNILIFELYMILHCWVL